MQGKIPTRLPETELTTSSLLCCKIKSGVEHRSFVSVLVHLSHRMECASLNDFIHQLQVLAL